MSCIFAVGASLSRTLSKFNQDTLTQDCTNFILDVNHCTSQQVHYTTLDCTKLSVILKCTAQATLNHNGVWSRNTAVLALGLYTHSSEFLKYNAYHFLIEIVTIVNECVNQRCNILLALSKFGMFLPSYDVQQANNQRNINWHWKREQKL